MARSRSPSTAPERDRKAHALAPSSVAAPRSRRPRYLCGARSVRRLSAPRDRRRPRRHDHRCRHLLRRVRRGPVRAPLRAVTNGRARRSRCCVSTAKAIGSPRRSRAAWRSAPNPSTQSSSTSARSGFRARRDPRESRVMPSSAASSASSSPRNLSMWMDCASSWNSTTAARLPSRSGSCRPRRVPGPLGS